MIPLLQATKAAFDERKIRIYPILTVIDEAGGKTVVPSELIISRPARSQSPVLSRSPVMRLDLELVPSDAMLALFKEQRRVTYAEIVNGQRFERFRGHVWALDKGWAVSGGAVVTSLKVTAYSESQRLAALDAELHHRAQVLTPGANAGLVLRPVVALHSAYLVRASSGNDPYPVNAVWRPHSGAMVAEARWKDAQGVTQTRTAGTHFVLRMTESGPIEVNWTSQAPAAGTAYELTARVVIAWVAPSTFPRFDDFTTPGATDAYELSGDEPSVEAIAEANFDYCRYFAPAGSRPIIYTRVGAGTGAATKALASDWDFALERGQFRYVGTRGLVFDTDDVLGGEVCFVGAKGLAWPDTSNWANSPEALAGRLYELAGALPTLNEYYGGFEFSGLTVAEFDQADKGDKLLQVVAGALPPNYVFYDDEEGLPRGRYFVQSTRPQLTLGSVKGLRDREPPEFFTRVVVRSVLEDQDPNWSALAAGIMAKNPYAALAPGDDTFAEPTAAGVAMRVQYPFNHLERFKSLKLRFEGEAKIMLAPDVGGAPDTSQAWYLPGYQVAHHGQAKDLSVGDLKGMVSASDPGPTWLVIEVGASSVVSAPRLYHVELKVDRVLEAVAMLRDHDGEIGTWVETTDGFELVVATDLLKRWLVNENRSDDLTTYRAEWWKHRTKLIEMGAVSRQRAKELARAHLVDVMRRATAQEIDVVLEPQVQLGDSIKLYDPATGGTLHRLVVGFRESPDWEAPAMTLEVADYA
jgi:hypothetical protein